MSDEAEIFFDDLHGGLIDVEQCQIVTADEARRRGREIKNPEIVLSDYSPLGKCSSDISYPADGAPLGANFS